MPIMARSGVAISGVPAVVVRMIVLVTVVGRVQFIAGFKVLGADKHSEEDAERVVRREPCGEQQDPADGGHARRRERLGEDHVLGVEPGRERESGEVQAADEHADADDPPALHFHDARQLAKVELAREAVHDRAAAEEEQGLKESVCDDVERGPGAGHDAQPGEHVPELADRRVGHDPLDIELGHADRRCEQGSERADPGHDWQGVLVEYEERVGSRDEEDASGDHRGGVDQGRDGRGAFHRVGQPYEEGQLGRLAERADHQQHRDGLDDQRDFRKMPGLERGEVGLGFLEDGRVLDRAEVNEGEHDPECEPEVADAVDDERFLGRGHRGGLFVEVPDQQVRAQPDALPA